MFISKLRAGDTAFIWGPRYFSCHPIPCHGHITRPREPLCYM